MFVARLMRKNTPETRITKFSLGRDAPLEEARQDGRIIPRDLSLSELPLGLDAKTLRSRRLFARYSTSLFENLSNFLILFRNASPSTLVDHSVEGIKIGCMKVVWKNSRGQLTSAKVTFISSRLTMK